MRWEELEDALEVLQSEREYDGYFCSIQDAVIIVTMASMCELKSVMRIHSWATTETVSKFLAQAFVINTPDASVGGVVLIRWLQSALIPFFTTQEASGVLKPPHE